MSFDEHQDQAMKTWSRMYDAHARGRGVRITFRELQMLVAIDGHFIQRFEDVEMGRERLATEQAEETGARKLSLPGLQDKLYWRQTSYDPFQRWHCFKKNEHGTFTSLCGRKTQERSGGQAIDRPKPMQRCGLCDGLEMKRRGWSESGPERRER